MKAATARAAEAEAASAKRYAWIGTYAAVFMKSQVDKIPQLQEELQYAKDADEKQEADDIWKSHNSCQAELGDIVDRLQALTKGRAGSSSGTAPAPTSSVSSSSSSTPAPPPTSAFGTPPQADKAGKPKADKPKADTAAEEAKQSWKRGFQESREAAQAHLDLILNQLKDGAPILSFGVTFDASKDAKEDAAPAVLADRTCRHWRNTSRKTNATPSRGMKPWRKLAASSTN
eukprot:TRINITY_DN1156_c0_g2_i1.p3 TRINITY_DN1156_c0_g2~~TRINITY_DN1156_c0_g2_i1.p3  ORF type:complete len:231 (+),score=58.15 TRINITY_DN1156_c0_g2_i1:422-1114(+)